MTQWRARREHSSAVPLLLAILLAAPASYRAAAEQAETLGRLDEAAVEYEAAGEEEQAPELLYRLGLTRRKLKQYGKAREAFRGYLRAAPDGPLRAEVERQLARLEVLIEAQADEYREPATAAPPESQRTVVQLVALPTPEVPAPAVERASLLELSPIPALRTGPLPTWKSRAIPWLVAGGGVALLAGAGLWWDGARVSNDLDARFARGDLTAADQSRYGRADRESIAGRVLVAAGVGLLAGAAALWW